jgi:hypothetical protein
MDPQQMQALTDIVRELEIMADRRGDRELDHIDADLMLMNVITILSKEGGVPEVSVRIRSAFERIPKWYS